MNIEISEEFKKMYMDISFGLDMELVFERFTNRINTEESQALSNKNRKNKELFENLIKDGSSNSISSQSKILTTEALALSSKNKKNKEVFEQKSYSNLQENNLSFDNKKRDVNKSNHIFELQQKLVDANTYKPKLYDTKKISKTDIDKYANMYAESDKRLLEKVQKERLEQERLEQEREILNEEKREMELRERLRNEQK